MKYEIEGCFDDKSLKHHFRRIAIKGTFGPTEEDCLCGKKKFETFKVRQ